MTDVQKIVIINGSTDMLPLLETILAPGEYDIVFVEDTKHAYSQVKMILPSMIVMCMWVQDTAAYQVLSMLKLDEETRWIPIVTYTTEDVGEEMNKQNHSEEAHFWHTPAIPMN